MDKVPNFLTYCRMYLAVIGGGAALTHRWLLASVLLIVAALTDILDGTIARYFHVESDEGKALDPLADRIFTISVLLGLVLTRQWAWWILVLIMFGEFALLWINRTKRQSATIDWLKKWELKTHAFLFAALITVALSHYLWLATHQVRWTVAYAFGAGLLGVMRRRRIAQTWNQPEE